MYSDCWSRLAALIIFVGFILTFLPQFVLGYHGMPRRYHALSARVPGAERDVHGRGDRSSASGYLLPLVYLICSLRLRQAGRAEPLARDRPGVADALAAAAAQFRGDARS